MRLKHPYNIVTFLVGFALFMLLVAISGCTVYKVPKPNITHVLAITAEGDTLKLPIDVIRPIYNYNNVTYPRTNYYPYHNYYYKPHNNINNWKPIGGGNSNYNNNNNNTTPVTPTVKPSGNVVTPPTPVNPRKN